MDEQSLALIEAQYERAQGKRFMYGFFFVLMLILVIVLYLSQPPEIMINSRRL